MSQAITLFGELLFDDFPDGRSVPGGAPLNVAWHLQALGARPLLVSRVGDDEPGRAMLRAMQSWGLDTSAVPVDPELPTGRVQVSFDKGEPSYDIVRPVAWDAIAPDQAQPREGWLYHGSLALRDERSRQALDRLAEDGNQQIFLDVNLRDPWWDRPLLERCLARATWAKLNRDELELLAPAGPGLRERALALLKAAALEGVVLTLGAEGAMILRADGALASAPAPGQGRVVDTVGAGDAFTAVMLLALRDDWPQEQSLQRAMAFAAAVCGQRGATTADRAFYEPWLAAWGLPAGDTGDV